MSTLSPIRCVNTSSPQSCIFLPSFKPRSWYSLSKHQVKQRTLCLSGSGIHPPVSSNTQWVKHGGVLCLAAVRMVYASQATTQLMSVKWETATWYRSKLQHVTSVAVPDEAALMSQILQLIFELKGLVQKPAISGHLLVAERGCVLSSGTSC